MRRYGMRYHALLAGVGFFALATVVQGVLPMLEPQSRSDRVTRVVRTDLGELKWTEYTAADYSPLQRRGREVYIREGCWYCHSQYVRPVAGESRRWGPITQAGEYAYDLPHLFSTRRIGPDLSRVGLKYSDDWHLAHFWDPRLLLPDSIMPRYAALFDGPLTARVVTGKEGARSIERSAQTEQLFDFERGERLLLTPTAAGLVYVPERGRRPEIFTPNDEFSGDRVQLVTASDDLRALIAYLQRLGTNRGAWRDLFEPQRLEASQVGLPRSEEWINHGEQVYRRRCLGCHGAQGDGNGPAATFLAQRPRNFTTGVFKFRLTPSGSLPDDGDLLRTITRGVSGTSMPTWHELPLPDRLAVIQYIKYVLAVKRSGAERPYYFFVEEAPGAPLFIGVPPTPAATLVEQGRAVWQQANCWLCHGQEGRGDGQVAAGLSDDARFPIRPANLATGRFKSGPDVKDIFRTVSTGLSGTPMPPFADTLSEADRWAVSYFVLSLSAFTDPLSGEPLQIAAPERAALNDPALPAREPDHAYRAPPEPAAAQFAGAAWARKHGIAVPAGAGPAAPP